MARSKAGELALEYLGRFPKADTQVIARKLLEDYPAFFSSVKQAATRVRYYRGAQGKNARAELAVKDHVRPKGSPRSAFAALPEPINGWEEMKVRKVRGKKVGVICDLHIPFHDMRATETALLHLKDEKIDTLIINGDLIDFYSISRWTKDPGLTRIREEYNDTVQFLKVMRDEFPDALIIWKEGNHEARWKAYLWSRAPLVCDLPVFTDFTKLFGLNKLRIKYSPPNERLDVGKLAIIHGHEMYGNISSAVNAARGLFLKAKCTAMCGHLHQTSQHSETDLKGSTVGTFSVGCLCQLYPDYSPMGSRWNHGFALIDKREDHLLSSVRNYKIIRGEVV